MEKQAEYIKEYWRKKLLDEGLVSEDEIEKKVYDLTYVSELSKFLVPKKHTKNVKKIKKAGFIWMKCVKTKKILPLDDFRIHKSGYYFSYCKKWEAAQAKIRREKNKTK